MAEEDSIEEVVRADVPERAEDGIMINTDELRRMMRRKERQSQVFIIDILTELDLEYMDRMLDDLPLKWNHLMPCTVAEIFCMAPTHLLDQAWKKLERGNPLYLIYCNLDCTLTEWKPSHFENEENRLYESFSPCIMCMKTETFRFVGYKSAKYNSKHSIKKRWYAFPSLAYLPTDVKKVVAGDGGLLVCEGGLQPRRPPIKKERLLPLTHDEEDDYDRAEYPEGQSVMLVTNPLTREYFFLPPLKGMILQHKCAYLVLVPNDGSSFNLGRRRTSSYLNRRMSSASLVGDFQPYGHDPNEYYPPGINPEWYRKGRSFRGSRIWQHNGTRTSFFDVKTSECSVAEEEPIVKVPPALPKTPQPRKTIHGSPGVTPGSQREVEELEALMAAEHDIHTKREPIEEDTISTSSEEIELDPYKNRLEEFCHHYMVVVMGYHHECATEDKKCVEELVCAVYKSTEKEEGWWVRPAPFKARLMPPQHGRTGLALLKNGHWMAVCFGALLVEEHLEEVIPPETEEAGNGGESLKDDETESTTSSKGSSKRSADSDDSTFCPADPEKISNLEQQSPPQAPHTPQEVEELDECGVTIQKLWCEDTPSPSATSSSEPIPPPEPDLILVETMSPALFYIPIVPEDDSALCFSFTPMDSAEGHLQAPIVVQPFGWRSDLPMLYAVTRKAALADTILIFAIGFDIASSGGNPTPSGHYIPVTEMPTSIFNDLFETIDFSQKEFECTAGNGLICIRVKDFKVLAIYDVLKKSWVRQDYAKYMPTKARARPYQMFENCVYEPNFWQKADHDDMDHNV